MDKEIKQGEKCTFFRGGQSKEVFVPLSNESMVLIPSNIKGTGFLRNLYPQNRRFLGGLISKKEFDSMVDTCSKLTAKVYSHNRNKDVEGIPQSIILSLALSSILLLTFFFLMYYGIRDDNEKARIAGFFMLAFSVFITFVIGLVNFVQRPDKYTPYKEMVRKTLLALFERLNKKYGNRGLEWDVRDNHYWIEIKIDKKRSEAYKRQTNYDPNAPESDEEEVVKQEVEKEGPVVNPEVGTDGNLYTAARDDDRDQIMKGQQREDLFENEEGISDILKKIR